MYLAGVSVRRVEDISEALWGSRVSASTTSELNQKAYVHIEDWRTRVVGAFTDGKSAHMLICARLRYVTGKDWGCKRYLCMK